MVTDSSRRKVLAGGIAAVGASLLPAHRAAAAPGRMAAAVAADVVLAATWQDGPRHFVGHLAVADGRIAPVIEQELPTRAHGLLVEPQGTVLVVARRPGDWLLRFDPVRREVIDWFWGEGDYVFNGHVIRDRDGSRLFTTETSLESGAGSIAVRHPATLAVLDRWSCAGIDPHELLLGPDDGLWIANGGIETRPETGRTKHRLGAMDSSLVRLDAGSGRLTGQWRLEDQRLGLRHLALFRDSASGSAGRVAVKIGIALQAEHDDAEGRQHAPVLAVWDQARGLRAVPLPPGIALTGYGGSIAALDDGFAVTCPKAGKVARWRMSSSGPQWRDALELPEACAVAAGWIGGAGAVLQAAGPMPLQQWQLPASVRLDNHWAAAVADVSPAAETGPGVAHG
jgi:hypothetical protein